MKKKMFGGASTIVFTNAKRLRHNMTDAETIVWGYLKTSPDGLKFRRQHPFGLYIADFYCHKLKLVIEIDGSIHNLQEVKENDIIRQNAMEKEGLKFIRFTNSEVMNNMNDIITKIQEGIHELQPR